MGGSPTQPSQSSSEGVFSIWRDPCQSRGSFHESGRKVQRLVGGRRDLLRSQGIRRLSRQLPGFARAG